MGAYDIYTLGSLMTLRPNADKYSIMFPIPDTEPCNRPAKLSDWTFYRRLEEKSRDIDQDWKKYKGGSTCRRRDMLLALSLDAWTTYLWSLQKFESSQIQTTDTTTTCVERSILAFFLVPFSTQLVTECSKKEVKRVGFASWEQYNEYIKALDSAMTKIYNTIDTWACRHEISDKSMTYHTLFLRKAEDVRAKAPQLGVDFPPILHFLEDYPERLNAMLKATTPDIGKPVKELIAGLKLRATITKTLMKSFGDDNKSQEEKDAIKKFCDIVDDGTLPKFPPADDDPVFPFPFLGGAPER